MPRWRASIRDHRHLALLVLALAFLVRAAMPAGYMVARDASSVITISVCSEGSGVHKTIELTVPAKPGDHRTGHGANRTANQRAVVVIHAAADGSADAAAEQRAQRRIAGRGISGKPGSGQRCRRDCGDHQGFLDHVDLHVNARRRKPR